MSESSSNHPLSTTLTLFFSQPILPKSPDALQRGRDAADWHNNFDFDALLSESDCEVEYEYALRRYDSVVATFDNGDEKLSSLVKFSTAVIASAIGFAKITGSQVSYSFTAGIVLSGLAMIFALLGRMAAIKSTPVDIDQLLDFSAKGHGKSAEVKATIAGSIHQAVECLESIIQWKSAHVTRATVFVLLGLWCFLWWAANGLSFGG